MRFQKTDKRTIRGDKLMKLEGDFKLMKVFTITIYNRDLDELTELENVSHSTI